MAQDSDKNERKHSMHRAKHGCYPGAGGCGAVYGLGFIGALIYFLSHASGFWIGVLGILKAIVWPAYLVYEAFNFLLK
jgi:hypothetical protein